MFGIVTRWLWLGVVNTLFTGNLAAQTAVVPVVGTYMGVGTVATGANGGAYAGNWSGANEPALADGASAGFIGGGGEPMGYWCFTQWSGGWFNEGRWSELAKRMSIDNFSYSETLKGKVSLSGTATSKVSANLSLAEVVSAGGEFQSSFTATQEVEYSVSPRRRAVLDLWIEMWTRRFEEEYRISGIVVTRGQGSAYQGRSSNFKFADGPVASGS